MLLTISAAIVVLGVLIFVHELGHFVAAKSVGIAVPRFSIGLGPVTPLSFRRGETEYVISWIPFGGYVKMATKEEGEAMGAVEGGEAEQEFPEDQLFENKPLWARIMVISAGVIMNLLFAWVVYVGLSWVYGSAEDPTTRIARVNPQLLPAVAQDLADVPFGTQIIRINGDSVTNWNQIGEHLYDPTSERVRIDFAGGLDPVILPIDGYAIEDRDSVFRALEPLWPPLIGLVGAGTPASRAGFEPGDLVLRLDEDTVRAWVEMVSKIEASYDQSVVFDVRRGDSVVALTAVPAPETVTDSATGEERTVGRLGIAVQRPVHQIRLGFGASLVEGADMVYRDSQRILVALRGLILGRISPRELGGPVFIGQLSGQTARLGLRAFLTFMALFSVNLAILNILPIPVLDGGHLVFLVLEGVRGKPLSLALRMRLTQFGLVLLLGIMVLAFTNDILRVFGL